MISLFFVLACFSFVQTLPLETPDELNGTVRLNDGVSVDSSDVADNYWGTGLSPAANAKRFKAIRAGLLMNLNESVSDLNEAIKSKDAKEVQYQLRKLNEKWERLEKLQRTIMQLIPDDDLEILVEESRLFEDNRDVVDRQRETATDFLLKTVQKTSRFLHLK